MQGIDARAAKPSTYDEKVRVYPLADPEPFRRNKTMIANIVQRVLGASKADPSSVDISEASAWLDYRAPGELWQRASPVLPGREETLRIAEQSLTKLQRECSALNDSWRSKMSGVSMLPPVQLLRRGGLAAVPRPDGSCWDHWLYRAEPQLPLDGGGKLRATVSGAQVEVRIGHLGRVIGLRSRWHPISGSHIYTDIRPFRARNEAEHVHGEREASPEPTIQYQLDGDGMPQYYLAPYHFVPAGHVQEVYSASPWALTVDIGRVEQGPTSMKLLVLAEGGSGDYSYNWGILPAGGLGAFVEIGRGESRRVKIAGGEAVGSQTELPNGVYIVVVNVRDRATGAFKHYRQTIASSPIQSPAETALVA